MVSVSEPVDYAMDDVGVNEESFQRLFACYRQAVLDRLAHVHGFSNSFEVYD